MPPDSETEAWWSHLYYMKKILFYILYKIFWGVLRLSISNIYYFIPSIGLNTSFMFLGQTYLWNSILTKNTTQTNKFNTILKLFLFLFFNKDKHTSEIC